DAPHWPMQWTEVRRMAQQLALAYAAFHRLKQQSSPDEVPHQLPMLLDTMPDQLSLQTAPSQEKRSRKRHGQPADLVTRDPPSVHVRSDQLAQEIMRGLLSNKAYTQYPDQRIAEYRQSFAKNKGQI